MKRMVVIVLFLLLGIQITIYSIPDQLNHHIPLLQEEKSIEYKTIKIERISPERIALHKKNIARSLTINKYLRYGLRGASIALMAGTVYLFYRWFSEKPEEISEEQQRNLTLVVAALNKNKSAGERLIDLERANEILKDKIENLVQLLHNKDVSFFSWTWWSRKLIQARDYGAYFILGPLLVSRVNSAIDGIFIDHNLDWFVTNKTTLDDTLKGLTHAAEQCDNPAAPAYQHEFYIAMIPSTCSLLLKQIETLIAFMEFSTEHMKVNNDNDLQSLEMMSRYLLHCAHDMCDNIEVILNSSEQADMAKKQLLQACITQFDTEVHNTINRFNEAYKAATQNDA